MAEQPVSVREWGSTGEAHMRITKSDAENIQTRYERELHVCPGLPNGVHVSCHIWGIGHENQSAAGLLLEPEEAVALVAHITRVLARGDYSAAPDEEQRK